MENRTNPFDLSIWKATFSDRETERAFLKHDLPATARTLMVTIVLLSFVLILTFVLDYTKLYHVAPSVMYKNLIARIVASALCIGLLFPIRKSSTFLGRYTLFFFVVAIATAGSTYIIFNHSPYLAHTDSPIWFSALLLFAFLGFPVPFKVASVYALLPITGAVLHQVLVVGTTVFSPARFTALMIAFGCTGMALSIRENLVRRKNFMLFEEQQAINERLTREVTTRKRIEALLNVRKDQLESYLAEAQRLESVALLTGGIAHDFNNLLLPIMGFAEMAERKLPEDSEIVPFLHQITHAAERAKDMVRQLLAFGRKQLLDVKQVNLNELIASIEVMAGRIVREDIEFVLELQEGLRPVVADPSQIEQILMNLIVNARDAMPGGGTMRISTSNIAPEDMESSSYLATSDESRASFASRSDMYVRITVNDTGTGIEPKNVGRIFDPFFTTKPKEEGTGLGLAMVYGIVSQHGGRISVESKSGEGTSIHIYLPSGTKAVSSHVEDPAPVSDLNGDETILLVEDEEVVREFVSEVLRGYGYKVIVASDGEEALQVGFELEEPINMLITDVVMPKLSGSELWKKLGGTKPEMRVLYISGYPNEDLGHHGVIAEGTHFLQKPFSSEQLAIKIRQTLTSE